MPKWVRVAAITLGSVAAVAGVSLGAAYAVTKSRFGKRYEIPKETLTMAPPAEQDTARGHAMAVVHACTHCHTQDLGGGVMPEAADFGTVVAPNLTRGGLASSLKDEDWARAVRHAVGHDGRPLLFMPGNHHFQDMPDEDLAALVQYLRSVPPVRRDLPAQRLSAMGTVLLAMGAVPLEADTMDHTVRPFRREPGVSVANGRHAAQMCMTCHASDMGGIPPGVGVERAGGNLTTSGPLGSWTEEDFVRFFKTGVEPSGRAVDPVRMPWKAFRMLSDDELRSIYAYLRSVPPVQRGTGKKPTAPAPAQAGRSAAR